VRIDNGTLVMIVAPVVCTVLSSTRPTTLRLSTIVVVASLLLYGCEHLKAQSTVPVIASSLKRPASQRSGAPANFTESRVRTVRSK